MHGSPRGRQLGVARSDTHGPDPGPLVFQELFSKQKGYLDEELDYRKQVLDQAHKVRETHAEPLGERGPLCPRPAVSQGLVWARPQTPDPEEPGPLVTNVGSLSAFVPLEPHCLAVLKVPSYPSSNPAPHERRHVSSNI